MLHVSEAEVGCWCEALAYSLADPKSSPAAKGASANFRQNLQAHGSRYEPLLQGVHNLLEPWLPRARLHHDVSGSFT